MTTKCKRCKQLEEILVSKMLNLHSAYGLLEAERASNIAKDLAHKSTTKELGEILGRLDVIDGQLEGTEKRYAVMHEALTYFASEPCCQTEGCTLDLPMCDAKIAQAALRDVAEVNDES